MKEEGSEVAKATILTYLAAGAVAGAVVDTTLYPLDTIKTRLQSQAGFFKSGGFRKIYAGLGSAIAGSAPNAAIFFCTYEAIKHLGRTLGFADVPTQMLAASCGEAMACTIRVPIEVIKQRAQTTDRKSLQILRRTVKSEGFMGLYRGYLTTVLREIPFSLIQFPLWEHLKLSWSNHQGRHVEPWQATICGAIAGGISAFLTTPLDVAKTRIMLAEKESKFAKGNLFVVLKSVWKTRGISGLFAGVAPRVLWISIGGALFLGSYETVVHWLTH